MTSTAGVLAGAAMPKDATESVVRELLGLGPQAYQVASRMLGTRSGAEDVVQEAYLRALQGVRPDSTPQQRRVWFLRVTANTARDRLRSEGRRRRRESRMRREPPASVPKAELLDALQVAVSSLDRKYRMPICLCYEQQLSQRDAAEVLNMPKSTVAKHITTGLAKLRKTLEHAGYPAAVAAVLGGLKQTAPAVPASLGARVKALVAQGAGAKISSGGGATTAAAVKGGLTVKILAGVALAGAVAIGVAMTSGDGNSPLPAEKAAGNVPGIVLDESAESWLIDRFVGNSTAGPDYFQGPARETGGCEKPAVAAAPDGSVYVALDTNKWLKDKIFRVLPDGTMRLVAGGGASLADGPGSRARIAVPNKGTGMMWSRADDCLYFAHPTIPALRRLYRKDGQWLVETVAGNPEEAGHADGPGKTARFEQPRSLAVASTGTVYMLDGTRNIRKIEKGQVSTLAKFVANPRRQDGPLAQATFYITGMSGQICIGENDDVLYVGDHWNFAARRIDLKKKMVTTVALSDTRPKHSGTRPKQAGGSDGPAMTHMTSVSGICYVYWDPLRKALWLGGPDEIRFRWLKDGWVKTVLRNGGRGKWPKDSLGVPAKDMGLHHVHVESIDDKGGVYIVGTMCGGAWRAYQKGGAR